jgi:L-alanine-DL-glutamate epimerase-like enolase superfamily enzyme
MIAPQARGLEAPDASGISAFMERIQRNLHLFGRYGVTMFAMSGLDIALWDLAARAKGEPLHRLIGGRKRPRISRLCEPASDRRPGSCRERMRRGAAPRLPGDQTARDDGAHGRRGATA